MIDELIVSYGRKEHKHYNKCTSGKSIAKTTLGSVVVLLHTHLDTHNFFPFPFKFFRSLH
jgi:hypothetical protein